MRGFQPRRFIVSPLANRSMRYNITAPIAIGTKHKKNLSLLARGFQLSIIKSPFYVLVIAIFSKINGVSIHAIVTRIDSFQF
jgi:hypothetical protein